MIMRLRRQWSNLIHSIIILTLLLQLIVSPNLKVSAAGQASSLKTSQNQVSLESQLKNPVNKPRQTPTPTITPTGPATTSFPSPTSLPNQCDLYPIALPQQVLTNISIGDEINNISIGMQTGNFGWLTWSGNPNTPTLITSLTPPGDSYTYTNPNDANDHLISLGDWIPGKPGVSNSGNVTAALDTLKTMDINVPVWSLATIKGNNTYYQVVSFVRIRLTEYHLPKTNQISVRFLGFACQSATVTITPTQTPSPMISPSPTPSVLPSITSTATDEILLTSTYTITPIVDNTLTPTSTNTPEPTSTDTPTAALEPTITATDTLTLTPTILPSYTPTYTVTTPPTSSPTLTPISTFTVTPTPSPFHGATLTISPEIAGPNVTTTNQTLTATLKNRFGAPMSGVNIQFFITGPNGMNDSTTTDTNGIATFIYTGLNNGTDSIQAIAVIGTDQLSSGSALVHWVTPVQQVSTTSIWGRFFTADGSGMFNIPISQQPVFDQTFPTINFNPPAGTVPGNTSVNDLTLPFTDVTTDINGNFTGTIIAQGNGYQAGVGLLGTFSAVFTGEYVIANAGDVTFNFFSDDGFIFSVGNGAARVSGPMINAPSSGFSTFANLPVMGAFNQGTGPIGNSVTVHFPSAGIYPYEVNYTECCYGQLSLTMTTTVSGSSHGVPPTSSLTISPSTFSPLPTGQQQTITVTAVDASGLALTDILVNLIINGSNAQQLSATTDASGQATFTYTGNNSGTDTIQAIAWVNAVSVFSAVVSVPWTMGSPPSSTGPLAIPGWIGSPTNQGSVSGLVPITLAPGVSLLQGTLEFWPANDPSKVTLLANNLSGSDGATLADLDTTQLPNGSYVIMLSGTNTSGTQLNSGILITITGEYKPGRVRFTSTDLTIPLAGLPITIARTYDSLTRDHIGDFGYGWSLAVGNPHLEEDPAHNVTITMPDGKRSTFYFRPRSSGGIFGFLLYPQYIPEAGVYGSFTARGGCIILVASGSGYLCFPEGDYQPTEYTYTDPAGQKFVMSADGTLKSITDLNNNVLTFSRTGITSTAGNVNIPFVRDTQGRITKITYPVGKDYVYGYNADGELDTVTLPSVTQPDSSQQIIALHYSYYSDHFFKDATDPRGNKPAVTTYDASNRVQSVTDSSGNQTTFDYDPALHKTTIHYLGDPANTTDDLGSATLTYDTAGYLVRYVDPLHAETIYTYDSNHNLIKVTDPLTRETKYTYNDQGHLTSIIDPLTHVLGTVTYNQYGGPTNLTTAQGGNATVTYDPVTFMPLSANDNLGTLGGYTWTAQGNPETSTDQYGNVTHYTYTAQGYLETKTDPLGHVTQYTYDEFGRVTDMTVASNTADATTTHTDYDELGRQTAVTIAYGTNRAATTHYQYDANGNRTAMIDPLGRRTEYQYDNADRLVQVMYAANTPGESSITKYVYDIYSRLTDTTIAFGTVDASTMHTQYDAAGRKTDVTIAYGTANASTTHYEYNLVGHTINVTIAFRTADASTTHYIYDAAGRTTDVTIAYNTFAESITHYGYYDSGLLQSLTMAAYGSLAATTTYFYDARGRSTVTQYADGTSISQNYDLNPNSAGWTDSTTDQAGVTTEYVYDAAGRLNQLISSAFDPQINQTLQHVNSYTYDAADRLMDSFDPLDHRTSFTYYPTGQMATSTNWLNANTGFTAAYDYNLAGEQVSVTDANNHTTHFQYNEHGRLKKTLYPGNVSTSRTYDLAGRLVAATDENGIVTRSAYNAAGELTNVTQAFGTADAITTQYGYNFAGQLTSMTDAKNRTTNFEYNAAGHQVKKILPDSTFEVFYFNAAGNMIGHGLTDFHLNSYAYDKLNRLTEIAYFDGQFANFTYRPDGQRETASTRTQSLAVPQVTTYSYDPFQRLKQVKGPDGRAVSYTYYDNGQRASMSTPAQTVTYGYDSLNRLTSVSTGANQTTTYHYDPVGFMDQEHLPNGVTTVYTPNVRNQLIGVTSTNAANTILESFNYQLDNMGNRTKVTELGGGAITWEYNNLYRLTGETFRNSSNAILSQASFHYDPVGNRDSMTVNGVTTNYQYNAIDQLTSAGAVTYQYDRRGNASLVTNGTNITQYFYDGTDRLTSVTAPSVTASYGYDADGRRIMQTVNNQTINYLWDQALTYGDVVLETDDNGATLASYVLGGNDIISQTRSGTTNYYLQDGQGSTRALTNNAGNVTDTYSYNAFGELFNKTGSTTNSYLYTGQQFDSLTGLYDLRARYYNPALGRFLSQDTYPYNFANPVELNRYVYTANNPINLSDPTGMNAALERWAVYIPIVGITLGFFVGIGSCQESARSIIIGNSLGAGDAIKTAVSLAGVQTGLYNTFNTISQALGSSCKNLALGALLLDSILVRGGEVNSPIGPPICPPDCSPPLPENIKSTFRNGQYSAYYLDEDLTLYRVHGGDSALNGPYYGLTKPVNAGQADALYNVARYGNNLTEVSTFTVRAGTLVYEGGVEGGTGTQFYIPESSGVRLEGTELLTR